MICGMARFLFVLLLTHSMKTIALKALFFGGMQEEIFKKYVSLAKHLALYVSFSAACVLGAVGIAQAEVAPVPSLRALEVEDGIALPDVFAPEQKKVGLPEVERMEPWVVRSYISQVTVYQSVPWETDSDPWTTAAGTRARDGVVAANCLPFGTLIRIPELFGDKVFVVEDRLHPRKSCYIIDVWREYSPQNKAFGAPKATIEILRTPEQFKAAQAKSKKKHS